MIGTGLRVDTWETVLFNTGSGLVCGQPFFYQNNVLIAAGPYDCSDSGYIYSGYYDDPVYYPNNTLLCNTWTGHSGKPCARIHT